jgi:hypothetical protein
LYEMGGETMLAVRKVQVLALAAIAAAMAMSAPASAKNYLVIRTPQCLRAPNPVVYDSGRRVTGRYYNRQMNHYRMNTGRVQVHVSALDPFRDHVDSGSLRSVNRYVSDGRGGYWHVRGWSWTSYGEQHEDISWSHVYLTSPWSSRQDTTRVVKEMKQGSGK